MLTTAKTKQFESQGAKLANYIVFQSWRVSTRRRDLTCCRRLISISCSGTNRRCDHLSTCLLQRNGASFPSVSIISQGGSCRHHANHVATLSKLPYGGCLKQTKILYHIVIYMVLNEGTDCENV